MRDTDHTLSAGAHLGPYEVTALLGVGGMGEVYRAHDPRLGRDVAIKVLPASVHTDPQARARFEREGRAISALNHPNICTLFDVGPNYLVTELVEGETLRNVMTKGLTVDRSIEIAKQVLEALCAAHRAAIIHRDLKPHNIMVRFDGYVKVLDFGLAKQLTELTTPDGQSRITSGDVSREGQILGTVAYMSPEQILGAEIDHRSDLFAVGIILHEMVSGRHPWPRPSPVDTLHAILHDAPPADAGSETVAELAIARKLLSKNAADRYPSAEAVLEALAVRSVPHASSTASASTAEALTAIAVLPFVFLNDAEERKAFALGFADALITVLGSLEDVAVLPTSAILNYAAGSDPAQTCRDLGVRHVLQGNVQKLGANWRVSIQLFDSHTQKPTLSEQYDFITENVFEVQDEIGRRVVESLRIRLLRPAPRSRDRYSDNSGAFEEFIAGLGESYSDREATLRSAAAHLSSAIERDPEFALAHATNAYVSMHLHWEFDAERAWLEKAEYHCGRALALDPTLPEAHAARAFILWSPAKNFQHAEAIAELELVLAAQPNNERAHNRMANICAHVGRFEEALTAHQRAVRSNPKTRSNNLEFIYLWSGDFDRADAAGDAWIREKPGTRYALWYHPLPALSLGNLDAAEQRLAAALTLYPDEPLIVSAQAMLHARRDQRGAALECIHKAQESPHPFGHAHHTDYQIASAYASLGETEKAMAWLQRSVDTGNPCWPFFKVDPHLESLRGDGRFERLVSALERKYTALKIHRL